MVDGVHGHMESVVRHVVEEYRIILECVMILNIHVEGRNVKVLVPTPLNVMTFAVQVNSYIGIHNKCIKLNAALFCKSRD